MLATTTRRLASASAFSKVDITSGDPTTKYDFVPAEARDKGEIMDITSNHIFTIEPHSRALGFTAKTVREFLDMIVSKALKYLTATGSCTRALERAIDVRVGARKKVFKADSDNIDVEQLPESTRILASILDNLKSEFWRLRPEAQKSSVLDGIMSEASYIANQTLLAKNGYEALASSKRKEYIRSNGEPVVFPDATTSVKLFYLNLKQAL